MTNAVTTTDGNSGLLCPACRVNLTMSERQGIEIDYCPNCRGVWLDRGELDKIIERSTSERPAAPAQQPYDQRTMGGHHGYHGGHHDSFFGRLFR